MKNSVCQLFNLVDNDKLSFDIKEDDIEESGHLKALWQDLIEEDTTCYRKIVASIWDKRRKHSHKKINKMKKFVITNQGR